MEHIVEQKCPSCGAPLRYDPAQGVLVCDYCGTVAEIAPKAGTTEVGVQGLDFETLNEQATNEGAAPLPIYNCVSCGAEVIAPAEQAALTCPYCGNNIVLTDKVSGKLRPDGVIPFRIDSKQLPGAMKAFYKGKALLPKRFFSESTMGKVTGVYVPFWIFDGRLTGRLDFHAERPDSHRSGDYEVTETRHFQESRQVEVAFADLPVDASGRIDDKLMDSLEPFRIGEAKPFDLRYLAGFTADRFDQAKEDVAPRAERRMANTAEAAAASTISGRYRNVRQTGGELRAELTARYMLLPVYLFSITHGGKAYDFAVNGQTGKVVGNIPTDKGVSFRYFLLRAGGAAAVVIIGAVVKYLLGG